MTLKESVPQGLKPTLFSAILGTTEVVPYKETRS